MEFISPTKGRMNFDRLFDEIIEYMQEEPDAHYRLIIGTDSQLKETTCFVTAVVIHRVGKGGRYFYTKSHEPFGRNLRQRVFYEAAKSLSLASRLAEKLTNNGIEDLNLEIHLDVGEGGATKDLIRDLVGMVTGSGFSAKIKPESYGASTVADRYTK